jgi:maltokinase
MNLSGTAAPRDVAHAELAQLVSAWIPSQRWFPAPPSAESVGVRSAGVEALSVLLRQDLVIAQGEPELRHLLVDALVGTRVMGTYQLLIGVTSHLPEHLEHARIGLLGGQVIYDACHDSRCMNQLIDLIRTGTSLSTDVSSEWLTLSSFGDVPVTNGVSIALTGEQSNTSVVFGETLILKLFRRIEPGVNPDLEVSRALSTVDCPSVIPVHGWIETELAKEPTTLAILQTFVGSAANGWAAATASVRDFFRTEDAPDAAGGDFAPESSRLGAATARVHLDLARSLPTGTHDTVWAQARAAAMTIELERTVALVPSLQPFAATIQATFDALAELPGTHPAQRIHGDLHLEQVLRATHGWLVLDFEGEPDRPVSERRQLDSPLRDVAGMLRSLDYVARHLLVTVLAGPDAATLTVRATDWVARNQDAFCLGYAEVAGFDPRDHRVLLDAFAAEKALYEVRYEAAHRPSWLPVALAAFDRTTIDHEGNTP